LATLEIWRMLDHVTKLFSSFISKVVG